MSPMGHRSPNYCFLLIFTLFYIPVLSCSIPFGESIEGPVEPPEVPVDVSQPVEPPSDIVAEDCTHFVSADGDDENYGDQDKPWASFERAVEGASAGDVICLYSGNYRTDTINLQLIGKPEAMITFAAYPGETPVLDGGGQVSEEISKYAGADAYGTDAMAGVSLAKKWIG